MTATITAPAKTTIEITWTNAPVVRIHANIDFPEYGAVKGEVIYLVRVTGEPGVYYVVRFVSNAWSCPCDGNAVYRRICKHIKGASKHSKAVGERKIVTPLVVKQLIPVATPAPRRNRAEAPLQSRAFPGLPPTWQELEKRSAVA